jgi:outer membrane protein assembly factor BamB
MAPMVRRGVPRAACAGVVVLALTVASPYAKNDGADKEWRYYSGDNGAKKYSPLDQINKENVATLRVAWRRPQVDAALLALRPANYRLPNNFRSTPIVVNGVMYASNAVALAEAFDPETGKTIWVQKPGAHALGGGAGNRGRVLDPGIRGASSSRSAEQNHPGEFVAFALPDRTTTASSR